MSATSGRRQLLRWVAMALVTLLTLGFLFPVLAGPVSGDDRYWYPWMGSQGSWSPVSEIQRMPTSLEARMDYGRVNFLTESERRTVAKAGIELSVATRTPVTVYNALLKLLLCLAGFACVLAMVRSLRWRDAAGGLARVSRRSLTLVAAAGALAVAVVARPHTTPGSTLNAWNSYPWSTYGAVASIFGVVALALWLSRRVADGGRRALVVATVAMALIGVATNFRYELAFPAVPLTVVALLVVPVTERAREREGRRAKLLVGAAYVGAFVPVFVTMRLILRQICEQNSCYEGVKPELGADLVKTLVYNVVSTFPGVGSSGLTESARAGGLEMDLPLGPTGWSVLAGLLVVVAFGLLWWTSRPRSVPDAEPTGEVSGRTEATLLLVGAGLFLLGALGAAGVMAVSTRSQSVVDVGILNRNAVVTTTGVVFALVLALVAVCRLLPVRAAVGAWMAFAVALAVTGTMTLPDSVVMLRSQRITYQTSEAVSYELVTGDLRREGNERRCELFAGLIGKDGKIDQLSTMRIVGDSNKAFQRYYRRPFCTGEPVVTQFLNQ
jgi:hypothetical protein